ncbi:MAG: XRE family transcriptional regulator [Treponema sp.]|nr:XRE family transcriptional regulator [Treponema sp.]
MQTEASRYNLVQQASGLSKKDFAESLGISKALGYQISTGIIKPSRNVLDALSKTYNVNLQWFITGSGSSKYDPDYAEIELYYQEVAAGYGRGIEEYIEKQYIPVMYDFLRPYNPQNLKAVYVSGDSMIGEHINNGDIVIFNVKQTEGNGIYVVSVENTLLVKRVDFSPANKTIELKSANPNYKPRRFSGSELNDIRIEGRVVAWYHKV